MTTPKLLFILSLLFAITYTQQVDVQALVANNTQLLQTLNNYFGCAKWNGDVCEKCSNRYFFNNKGICCQVAPECKLFNQDVGICEQCYEGYNLYNGTCRILTSDQQVNPGCLKRDDNQKCLQCSARFVPKAQGQCLAVSDNCRTWNTDSGACLTCYAGYVVSGDQCILNPQPFVPSSNDNCKLWKDNVCIICQNRAYFDSKGVCQLVSDFCNTWDPQTGLCLTCYPGFILSKGACQLAPNVSPSDIGCKIWQWNTQKCLTCSQNWVFNADKICIPVSDKCATSDSQGLCASCFKGYELKSGSCIISASNINPPSDLGCKKWSWDSNTCLECSNRYFFDSNKKCGAVSDLCNTYDSISGICTSCFKGFILNQGSCATSNPVILSDVGCASWNWDNLTCLSCSKNWILISNKCVAVSDQCLSWDQKSGDCLTCYLGYNLSNGKCLIQDLSLINPKDKGCSDWNWSVQICLKCSNKWYLNNNGVCTPVSDLCKTNDLNGQCLNCYDGYSLNNGACVANDFVKPSDLGCGKWDWSNKVCISCSNGFVFNNNKVCVAVSDQCKSYAQNGACTLCFKGYDLLDGICSFSASNNAKPSDSGCAVWQWDLQKCKVCSKNWIFNSNNICVPINDQCKTYSDTGACTSCFKGYDLINGTCLFSDSNNDYPTDQGCYKWDWDNRICLQCAKGYLAQAQMDGKTICVIVTDLCKTYNADSSACTSCFKGYDLKDGSCILSGSNNAKPSDLGCSSWDWDQQICLACSKGFVFNSNKICVAVSDQCATYDIKSGACTSCFKGYDLENGICKFSSSNNAQPADLGCAKWSNDLQTCLECSKGFVFKGLLNGTKACAAVSDQCKTYDSTGGDCTSCFKGYDLVNGNCVFSSSNNAKPSDLGCSKWNWDQQICIQCSKGYYFNSNKVCTTHSDQCKTISNSGLCISCFKGYDLVEGNCALSASNTAKPSDLGCANWNWESQLCLQCSKNWVFNSAGICVPVSDLCNTWNDAGQCITCFKGYDLVKGTCVFSASNTAKPSDLGCTNWDWNNQICITCSKGFIFNSKKNCVAVSDRCKTYNSDGLCTSCFKGYNLNNGSCILSGSNNAKPSDLGCSQWDWDNQICLACSKGFVFNSNKICVAVSDQCKTYDNQSGACTSCFKGYDLTNGACTFSSSNNAKPSQLGCAKWQWDSQVCLECSKRWVFNSNKQCIPVDDKCSSWDTSSGACTSCFNGFILQNGQCALANPLCKTSNASGQCTSCFTGYVAVTGNCIPISKLASIYLYYAQCCPEKLAQLQKNATKSG